MIRGAPFSEHQLERKSQLQEVKSKQYIEYSGSKNSEQEITKNEDLEN